MNWTELENRILLRLEPTIAACIRRSVPLYQGTLEEIRIRTGRPLALTISGTNVALDHLCSAEMVQETVQLLCSHSLYSHAETIREGFICVTEGIRAGVCGRAVVENGRITVLRDISSICIRIPHRIPDAGNTVYKVLADSGFTDSILVFSPPGMGKTTVLRELAAKLSDPPEPVRVALVDTRYELSAGLENCMMLDVLSGYPRSHGMEIAMRTLSPEYIICDELSSREDRQALLQCIGSGIRICTSVHAGSYEELLRHPVLQEIPHTFQWYYGLAKDHTGKLIPAREE